MQTKLFIVNNDETTRKSNYSLAQSPKLLYVDIKITNNTEISDILISFSAHYRVFFFEFSQKPKLGKVMVFLF